MANRRGAQAADVRDSLAPDSGKSRHLHGVPAERERDRQVALLREAIGAAQTVFLRVL
jgi:hypothetical protein